MDADPESSPLSSLASSPLSFRSVSPTPPPGLGFPSPSPSSAQLSESRSSVPPDASNTTDPDGPPPTKKRKIAEAKPRTTEYLNLESVKQERIDDDITHDEYQLQRLLHALRTKRKIVVIAGAGISVSAGIPDFRSSTGLFKTLRNTHKLKASGKHLFDASVYRTDSSTSSFHTMVRELSHMTRNAQPTLFHKLLASLAEEGRLLRLYSQNVDGIDTAIPALATTVPLNTKAPWPKTIQLHGGLEKMVCSKCGDLSDFKGELFEGPSPPSCKACEELDQLRTNHAGKRSHGIGRLRPRIVLYNEFNPDDEAIGAVTSADLRSRPDCVLVVGTSLKVPGVRRIAREMCQVTRGRRDGFTAWINHGPEPPGNEFKECWDLVVRGDCDDIARQSQKHNDITRNDLKKLKQMHLDFAAKCKSKSVAAQSGILTPTASPRGQSPTLVKLTGPTTLRQPQFGLSRSASTSSLKTESKPRKTTAAKKKGGRKSEPAKATNKITSSFAVSKKAVTPKEKTTKKSIKKEDEDVIAAPPYSDAMQPISLSEVRNNSDGSPSICVDDKKMGPYGPASPTADSLPQTPSAQMSPSLGYRETISPKNRPNNMAHLID